MYIKKVKLSVEDLTRLLNTGECECVINGKELKIGSTYEVWGADGYFVKVYGYDGNKYVLRKNEGNIESTSRAKTDGLRKVNIMSRLDKGMFVGGKSKFDIGEEVAVSESYADIVMRLGEDGYKFIADALGMESRSAIHASAGWGNPKYVDAIAMPRRIRILSKEVRSVSDISEKEWLLMGVVYNETNEKDVKSRCVGRVSWMKNSDVVLYRYETVSGSVEHFTDVLSAEQRREYARIMLSEGEDNAREYQKKVAEELYE